MMAFFVKRKLPAVPVVKLRAQFAESLLLIKIESRSANCERKIKRRLKRCPKKRCKLDRWFGGIFTERIVYYKKGAYSVLE